MYLGFDTSNYTTSAAIFDGIRVQSEKKLLSVKPGNRGLRQSEALFQHTVNLPEIVARLDLNGGNVKAVAVSSRPRNVEGSYMPCFLAGVSNAAAVSRFSGAPLYRTSHQVGHILAALYSVGRLDLINQKFIAFHISGGTTEALMVEPHGDEIIRAVSAAHSTDLNAGQAIDRAGVMMGLTFPCGGELDRLACKCDAEFKIKPSMQGMNCSLSGIENKAQKLYERGAGREEIAKFVISCVCQTIDRMTELVLEKYGDLPIVFAGGVMSNTLIKNKLSQKYGAYFAEPQFSCDNAAGIAVYAFLKDESRK